MKNFNYEYNLKLINDIFNEDGTLKDVAIFEERINEKVEQFTIPIYKVVFCKDGVEPIEYSDKNYTEEDGWFNEGNNLINNMPVNSKCLFIDRFKNVDYGIYDADAFDYVYTSNNMNRQDIIGYIKIDTLEERKYIELKGEKQ
jgi:hypothetical protein